MEEAFCFPTCTYLEKHIKHVFSIYFSDGLEPVQAPHTASQNCTKIVLSGSQN